ncbi:hypothetical protein [Methanobrevibacter thaueri]|uniref:hypothetical protein n=1 Tax=Methanobrevibacter thaueri TaxID=190975 RepID=UPI003868CC38
MTDFRRLCLEAEEKSEFNAAPDDMDDGQQLGHPYADEIKRLEDEFGPFANGMCITVELKKLLEICPRRRRRKDAYRNLQKTLDEMGVTLKIKSQKG